DLDMSSQPILNIGVAGTDFGADGGLTLAGDLVVTGGDLTIIGQSVPGVTTNGTIYYDTDTNTLNGRIGGAWVDLGQSAGVAGNMDAAYNLFGAFPALVEVDAAQGQTTGLTFRSNAASGTGDIIVDLNSTGDFKIQDASANHTTFNDDGSVLFYGSVTLGDAAGDNVSMVGGLNSNVHFNNTAANYTITGPSDGNLTVQGGAGFALNLTSNAASLYQTTAGGLTLTGATTAALNALAGAVTITSTGAGNDIVLNSADTIELQDNVNAAAGVDITGALTVSTTSVLTGNVDANDGLDVAGGALSFTGTAGSWTFVEADSALTQTGAGQVTFTGNVNATLGLDVTGADFTVGGGYGATGVTITDAGAISANGAIVSGSTITIDGNVGTDSIVSTRGLTVQSAAGNLALDTDGAGTDIILTPTDDLLATLLADGRFSIDAAATDNTTTTGVLGLTVDSLTTGNSALYIDYEVLATAAGTQSAINIPQITNTGSATVANVYGLYMQGISADGAGDSSAIYIPDSNWDYAIRAVDTVRFDGIVDLNGSVDADVSTFNLNASQGDNTAIVMNASHAAGGIQLISGTGDIHLQTSASAGSDIILDPGTNNDFGTVDINSGIDLDAGTSETVVFTSGDADGSNFVTINDLQNPITGQTWLLTLAYTDDGEALADFLVMRDNNNDVKFSVSENGATVITGLAEGTDALTVTAGDVRITDGDLIVSAGDIDFDGVNFTADMTGTISLDAALSSNFTVTGAAQDLTLSSVGGSVNVTATEAAANQILLDAQGVVAGNAIVAQTTNGGISLDANGAVNGDITIDAADILTLNSADDTALAIDINATAGGIAMDAANAISLDAAAASNFTVTGVGNLTLLSVDATNASNVVIRAGDTSADHVLMNGNDVAVGAEGDFLVRTGNDIDFDTSGFNADSTNYISLDAASASNFSVVTSVDAEDLLLAVTGATNSSVLIQSSGTAGDAIAISTSAGGMDLTVAGAAADEDLDLTANTSINLTANEAAANAIYLNATAGGMDIDVDADLDIDVEEGGRLLVNVAAPVADTALANNISVAAQDGANAQTLTIELTGAADDADDFTIRTTGAEGDLILSSGD
ncbi:MAG: hypothetical protein WC560_12780, partial [Syntrophales bacterium]